MGRKFRTYNHTILGLYLCISLPHNILRTNSHKKFKTHKFHLHEAIHINKHNSTQDDQTMTINSKNRTTQP